VRGKSEKKDEINLEAPETAAVRSCEEEGRLLILLLDVGDKGF